MSEAVQADDEGSAEDEPDLEDAQLPADEAGPDTDLTQKRPRRPEKARKGSITPFLWSGEDGRTWD
jgi:hypothetical protein